MSFSQRARRFATGIVSQHLIWLILLVLVCIGLFVPGFLSTRNVLNVLWAAAPLGATVLGMFFVMLMGGLDLSLESTFAFAPTVAIMLMTVWMPDIVTPAVAIVVTLLVGVLVGALNGFMSVKLRVNPFLVTLGTLLVLRGLVVYLIPEACTTCRRNSPSWAASASWAIFRWRSSCSSGCISSGTSSSTCTASARMSTPSAIMRRLHSSPGSTWRA
ncbi:MAG: hypothetical protein U0703_05895 [Anaerolineae bacterium]